MVQSRQIDIVELFARLSSDDKSVVFADEYFQRQAASFELDTGLTADIIADCIDSDGVKCCHFSMYLPQDQSLEFVFNNARADCFAQGRLISYDNQQLLVWIPKDPVSRRYDSHGRIEQKADLNVEIQSSPNQLKLTTTGKAGHKLEFGIVFFTRDIQSFKDQITNCAPIELRKVAKTHWFFYENIRNVWDYLVNDGIFSCQNLGHKSLWQSQNPAYALYYYLTYLYDQTGKKIYRLLCDFIAYVVMLSLPENGRWRHGIWTDIMETHMVYQAAGIHVLLSYYERTRQSIFLQKAVSIMDYLISAADKLTEDEIWFLHDSLELNVQDAELHYKNLKLSTAFGKSRSNTLCLNSHIWTLTTLHRLNQLAPSQQYSDYFEKGLGALKRVLQAEPAGILYSTAYKPRDILVKLSVKTQNRLIKRLTKMYSEGLKQYILPHLKKFFPRLSMPNGFIERDLSATCLSDFYHHLNIKDMLILYGRIPADWLREIIDKSISYTVDCSHVTYLTMLGARSVLFLDILLLYTGLVDDKYLRFLPEYISVFRKAGLCVSVDILSNPFVAGRACSLQVDNNNIVVLTPAGRSGIFAIIVNATDKDEKITIKSESKDQTDRLKIVDSHNRDIPWKDEIVISKLDYVKVLRS